MATAIPSNSAISTLFNTRKSDPTAQRRLEQLNEDSLRFDREDYRTVGTDRGPVRGLGGGARRR